MVMLCYNNTFSASGFRKQYIFNNDKKKSSNHIMSSFKKHDHSICSDRYKASIEKYCHQNNLEPKPLRQKVFEILIRDHKPLGAYEILDVLNKEEFSSSPPIAYRVLDFLIEKGLVHKIKGLNSFIACAYAGCAHIPAFVICRKCENVAEIEGEENFPKASSSSLDLRIENAMIEISDICSTCSDAGVC